MNEFQKKNDKLLSNQNWDQCTKAQLQSDIALKEQLMGDKYVNGLISRKTKAIHERQEIQPDVAGERRREKDSTTAQ